jgi:Tol biopolymer transport system component
VPPTIPPATLSSEATIEAVVSPCGDGRRIQPWQWIESLSPNGQWVAFQCSSEELGTYANIIGVDSSISWQVSYKQTYAANNEDAKRLAALVIPFHWSADGRFFYLTIHFDAMDGPGMTLVNGHALFRLDLMNGQVVEVLPPVPFLSYAMSISPNGRFLAYAKPGENSKVYIRDFRNGQENAYSLPDEFDLPAFFVWSDDGKKLVFSVANENFGNGDYSAGFGLFLLDRESDTLSLLVTDPPHLYFAKQWISDTKILISILWDEFGLPDYIFDLETMNLTPISTPEPN